MFKIKYLFRFFRNRKEQKRLQNSLESFEKGGRYNVDLSEYLRRFLKKGFKEQGFSKYDIHLFYKEGGSGSGYPDYPSIFFDAFYNFILLKNKKPICNIGFNDSTVVRPIIVVKQIQGVRDKQKALSPFRWEKMLLQIVIDWARQSGFKRVDVIKSEKSRWCPRQKNSEIRKRMYLKYDITAQRMGFKLNKQRGIYSLYLKQENQK